MVLERQIAESKDRGRAKDWKKETAHSRNLAQAVNLTVAWNKSGALEGEGFWGGKSKTDAFGSREPNWALSTVYWQPAPPGFQFEQL